MSVDDDAERPLATLAANLAAIANPTASLTARLFVREEALQQRFRARRYNSYAKLFDTLAKFGGGSLLTTIVSLILADRLEVTILMLGASTLLCFVGGAILSIVYDMRSARTDHAAERLEAVLKETEQ